MEETLDLHALFALAEPDGLPPLSISPAFHESSLAFLESFRRNKSEALKVVIKNHGWLDAEHFGENTEAAAFMIVLHADYDLEFQIMCHELILASAARGTTKTLGFLAFLTDRILCNLGKRQRFGTQIREVSNGCFVPKPMQDAEQIDALREQAGLGETLSDYYLRVNRGDLLLFRPLIDEYARELEEVRENKVVPLFPENTQSV